MTNIFNLSKDTTSTKIKTASKDEMMNLLFDFLTEKFGEDNVGMVRIGKTSKSNEIGVRAAVVSDPISGESYDLCLTINAVAKDFAESTTRSGIKPAFSFDEARAEYEAYLVEKNARLDSKKKKSGGAD